MNRRVSFEIVRQKINILRAKYIRILVILDEDKPLKDKLSFMRLRL